MNCGSQMSYSSGMNWTEYTQFLADRKAQQDVTSNHPNQYSEMANVIRPMYSQPSRLASSVSHGLDAFSRAASARADNSRTESQGPLLSSTMTQPPSAPPSSARNWGPRRQSVLLSGNIGGRAFSTPPRNFNVGGMSTTTNEHPAWHRVSERADGSRRNIKPSPAQFQNCSSTRSYDSQLYSTTRTSVPSDGNSRASSMERLSTIPSVPVYNNSRGYFSTSIPSALSYGESSRDYSTTRSPMPSYGEPSRGYSAVRSSMPSYDGGRGTSIEHSARSSAPEYGVSVSESSYSPTQFNTYPPCMPPRLVAIPLKSDSTANDAYELESAVSEASIAVMESLALTEVREKENMLKKLEDMQSYRRKFILGALPEPPEIVLEKCVQNLLETDSQVYDSVSTELMESNLELESSDSDEAEEDEYFRIMHVNS